MQERTGERAHVSIQNRAREGDAEQGEAWRSGQNRDTQAPSLGTEPKSSPRGHFFAQWMAVKLGSPIGKTLNVM